MGSGKKSVLCVCAFLMLFPSAAFAAKEKEKKERDRYQDYQEIPYFVKFNEFSAGKLSRELFMKQALLSMRTRLINAPRSIKYLDKDGNITRESLEKYKKLAADHVAKMQKRRFIKLNLNGDGVISLAEMAQANGFLKEDVETAAGILKKEGALAMGKLKPLLAQMKAHKQKNIDPAWFIKEFLLSFIELDSDFNQELTMEEMDRPIKAAYKKETQDVIANFESYLSLTKDRNSTTLEQVSATAQRAFNTVDLNASGVISQWEYTAYKRGRLPGGNTMTCGVPSLVSDEGHVYAIAVDESNALAALDFRGFRHEFTRYFEVNVEKQTKPLTLLLASPRDALWSIKGDTGSLNKVIVFGPSDYRFTNPEEKERYAAITGVPKDKVFFSSTTRCWKPIRPRRNDSAKVVEASIKKMRGDIKALTGRYPHLLKSVEVVSKIEIGSSPGIYFKDHVLSKPQKKPEGFNKAYWEKFLEWKSYLAMPKAKDSVSGAYVTESRVLPDWAGLAQLEKEGVLSPLHIDHDKRQAVFLMKKDLPAFTGIRGSNPTTVSLIKDLDELKFPETRNNRRAFSFCVLTRKGKLVHGAHRCSQEVLAYLAPEKDIVADHGVKQDKSYFVLHKHLALAPAYKDDIEIRFFVDTKQCKKAYGEGYRKKCQISIETLPKEIPVYAASIKPHVDGRWSWKDNYTLKFSPSGAWQVGGYYTLDLNLDQMGLPGHILINKDQRKAEVQVIAAAPEIKVSNLRLEPNPVQPESRILSANIMSNYPLLELAISGYFVSPAAQAPDENIMPRGEMYEYAGLTTEDGTNAATSIEMPDRHAKLRIILDKEHEKGWPLYMFFQDLTAEDAAEHVVIRPLWRPLFSEKSPDYVVQLMIRANKGDVQSQLALGKLYFEGKDIKKSLMLARYWFMQAAEQRNIEAYNLLGQLNLSYSPYSEDVNIQEAFFWYMRAAVKGNIHAQYRLGRMYFNDINFRDYEEGRKWIEKAAEKGHIEAINYLGLVYERGYGIGSDPVTAKTLYESAAKLEENPVSYARLARLYHLGQGMKQDEKQAYAYAQKALELMERDNALTREIAPRIVAEILMDEVRDLPFKEKAHEITKRVFNDFSKYYSRMWIANAINDKWDGANNAHLIAKALAKQQQEKTPDLAEADYVYAKALLHEGYLHGKKYELAVLNKAIKVLENIKNNLAIREYVFNSLIGLYLSKKDMENIAALMNEAKLDWYFTTWQLAPSRARLAMATGNYTTAHHWYSYINDEYNAARAYKYMTDNTDELNKAYLKKIKENPDHAWTQGNYASFLLHSRDDYEGAIKYGEKALSIMNYPMVRSLTGLAYLVKASQLHKDGKAKEAQDYMKKGLSYGLNKWYVQDNCGNFCNDIIRMLKDQNVQDQPI